MVILASHLQRRCWFLIALAAACGGLALGACSSGATAGPGNTVDPSAAVDSVVLSLDSAEVIIGDTVRLVAVPRDVNGKPVSGIQLAWTTSDPDVATVSSDGLVTGVDFGEADIDVTVVGPSASSTAAAASARSGKGTRSRFHVSAVPNITITPSNTTTDIGTPAQFTAQITNLSGGQLRHPPVPRWSSSAVSVATVDIAGFATPVTPGTTTIRAVLTAPVSGQVLAAATATLTVTVCEGLLDVASWDATVSTSYQVPTTIPAGGIGESYTVDQSSQGTALLMKTGSNNHAAVWEGAVSGKGHVDNKAAYPNGGVRTEIGDGPQSFPGVQYVRLVTEWHSGLGCLYSIRYRDQLKFVDNDKISGTTDNVDIPLGIAVDKFRTAGLKPASGWWLSQLLDVKAVYTPGAGDDELDNSVTRYYIPTTNTAVSLLAQTPSQSVGTARFNYILVAH